MKLSLVSLSFLASSVVAQSSTVCPAQDVLESCLGTTQGAAAQCSQTDYNCLCQAWTSVDVCYLQCPNDPRAPSASSTKQSYCQNASIYSPSTGAAATPAPSKSAGSGAADSTATNSPGASSSPSTTPGSKTAGAADLAINAGGVLAAVAGVMAAVL